MTTGMWLDSDDPSGRTAEAVSPIAQALNSLVANGLVEVRRFRAWPSTWDEGAPVDPGELADESRAVDNWCPPDGQIGMLVASITDAGVPWL